MAAPVLLVADAVLPLQDQSEALPPVQPGQAFWSTADAAPGMISAGQAHLAPPGTAYPRQPPHTVRGQPGFGSGAANSSP
jgi:hypothetical protein